jgi:short-subunit dehydrogenase
MIKQGSGHIINTASVAGLVTTAGQTMYGATKHAVVALSKSLRIEGKFYGVRVSVLCPGAIRTPILNGGKYGRMNLNAAGLTELKKLMKLLRPMQPEVLAPKVAAAVARNQAFIVLPAWWRMIWLLERISPLLSSKLCELGYARVREAAGLQTGPLVAAQTAKSERRAEPN